MKKYFSLTKAVIAALAAMPLAASGSVADSWPIPDVEPGYSAKHGATMPYTRYDFNEISDGTLSNGASLKTSPNWDAANKASQASNQAYVALPVGASVSWLANSQGDGVTVRFTIKDSHVGEAGKANGYADNEGHLEFYVNGIKAGEVDLTSYFMYQYFSYGSGSPSQSSGDAPCFCFDERHLRLNRMVKPGDTIEVKCTKGEEVGVDFLELEVVPDALDPADEANGRSIFDVTNYGGVPNDPTKDNRSAFEKAFNAASAVGGIMFVPEGTWYMGHNGQGGHGILSLSGKNVKVMGAGMWYTNIQFTGWEQFGGGISGGNPSNTGGKSAMDNIEWCHMYINSNLSDRHGENAVYKCFMDIWCEGSVLHDIWEQHFECGFWFGDYNNANKKSEVKVVNCRIRDNYADGVNFCRGTSNSTVYNCSVRNNGDDGLACWDDPALGSQKNNTFCFNTIDFIWRAGGIAIYGGSHQRAYNNYICDMFMAAGIHINDIFSRGICEDIVIEENVLVRCGTLWESWGRDYGAIDCEGDNTATFRNNYLYDCPAEALRIKGSNNGVVIDGLYVNGAGVSQGTQKYSASEHSACLANIDKGSGVTITNFQIVEGSVPEPTVGTNLNQLKDNWPFWDYRPATGWSEVDEDAIEWAEAPAYPDAKGIEPPVNVFETLTDYDIVMTGIDWITSQGKHSMYDGDAVTFSVRIDNKGKNSIPADAKFNVTFSVDGKNNYSYSVKDGVAAGGYKIIEFPTPWIADKGMHTFTATVDPAGKLLHETDRTNNSRAKDVNVNEIPEGEEPEIEITTHSGPDMGVVKVYFENLSGDNDVFNVGDKLRPHAIVANYGSTTIKLGSGQGFLWGFDGVAEYSSGMLWDDSSHTLAPGQWIDIVPNGGGNLATGGWNNDYTYTVKAETVELFGRMDNPSNYQDNNADNNSASADYTFPKTRPVYNDNPDRADNLYTGGFYDYEDGEQGGEEPVTGFDLIPTHILWNPGDKEIEAGIELKEFIVKVKNDSNVDLPEGKTVRVNLTINGKNIATETHSAGIAANETIDFIFDATHTPETGGHTIKATITPLSGEANRDNNSRERTLNARGEITTVEPANYYDTGFSTAQKQGRSLVLTRISWYKVNSSARQSIQRAAANEPIRPGDQVVFVATVYNNGTEATPNAKHGFLIETMPGYDPKYWSDDHKTSMAPGETVELTTCDGTSGNKGIWTAVEGTTTFRALLDDQNEFGLKQGIEDLKVEITSAPAAIEYFAEPTGHDGDTTTIIDSIISDDDLQSPADDIWYNLQGIRIERPTTPGLYINNGQKIIIR